jgi:hypothetical protein
MAMFIAAERGAASSNNVMAGKNWRTKDSLWSKTKLAIRPARHNLFPSCPRLLSEKVSAR